MTRGFFCNVSVKNCHAFKKILVNQSNYCYLWHYIGPFVAWGQFLAVLTCCNSERVEYCSRIFNIYGAHESIPPGWESIPGLINRVYKYGLSTQKYYPIPQLIRGLITNDDYFMAAIYSTKPEFVNLLWSPGINSQPGGQLRQLYLTYPPASWRNRFLGSLNVYKYELRT